MPAKKKITSEQLLEGAFDIVRVSGYNNLNARNLALQCGCSTQPIYSSFSTMNDLYPYITTKALEIYQSAMCKIDYSKSSVPVQILINYINFSQDEPNLFEYLFMRDLNQDALTSNLYAGDDKIVHAVMEKLNLDEKATRLFMIACWTTAHSIATLKFTNTLIFSDEDIEKLITRQVEGQLYLIEKDKKGE